MHKNNHKQTILTTVSLLAVMAAPCLGQDDAPVFDLNPFEVSAVEGYTASNTVSATGLNTRLLDVPMAISVITSDFLEDSNIAGLDTAMDYTASVTKVGRSSGFNLRNANFSVRGFNTRNTMVDGVTASSRIPTMLIERIEVVKGPNTLYGQTDPGGLINITTKKPLPEDGGFLTVKAGEHGWLQFQGDVTVRALDDKLGLRLLADYSDIDGYMLRDGRRTRFVGLSGQYQVTEKSTFSLVVGGSDEYGVPNNRVSQGFVRYPVDLNGDGDTDDAVRGVPESAVRMNYDTPREFSQMTDTSFQSINELFVQARYVLQLSDNNTLSYQYGMNDGDNRTNFRVHGTFRPYQGDANNLYTPTLYFNDTGAQIDEFHTINDNIQFQTGDIRHEVLIGARVGESRRHEVNHVIWAGGGSGNAILDDLEAQTGKTYRRELFLSDVDALVDITDEDGVTDEQMRTFAPKDGNAAFSRISKVDTYYITDNIFLLEERMNILAGLRYTSISLDAYNEDGTLFKGAEGVSRSDPTIQLGGVYRVSDNVSVYANYADAFEPQTSINNQTGVPFGNVDSEAFEGGVKFSDLMDGKVSGSVALFQVTKENLVKASFNPDLGGNYQNVSDDEVTGLEVELFIKPLDNWDIVISYANYDGEVVAAGDSSIIGNPLAGVAPQRLSVFTSYKVVNGPLEGFRFGGGIVWAQGDIIQFGNPRDRLVVEDGYTEIDLFARYPLNIGNNPVTLGVNIDNVGDEYYFRGSGGRSRPRTVLFSVTTEF